MIAQTATVLVPFVDQVKELEFAEGGLELEAECEHLFHSPVPVLVRGIRGDRVSIYYFCDVAIRCDALDLRFIGKPGFNLRSQLPLENVTTN